jgi:hypothetical protein
MERNRILAILEQGAGTEFDATLAHAFVSMIRKWEDRIADVSGPTERLPEPGAAGGDEPPPPTEPPREG